jgi:hypothetical protein
MEERPRIAHTTLKTNVEDCTPDGKLTASYSQGG